MEFKYFMKGKGRKNVIEVFFKFLMMDKEKIEERKGDILEEILGWYGIIEYFLLFGFNEEEKMENVDEEEREKGDEEREMERKKKKKRRNLGRRKRRKLRRKKRRKLGRRRKIRRRIREIILKWRMRRRRKIKG